MNQVRSLATPVGRARPCAESSTAGEGAGAQCEEGTGLEGED